MKALKVCINVQLTLDRTSYNSKQCISNTTPKPDYMKLSHFIWYGGFHFVLGKLLSCSSDILSICLIENPKIKKKKKQSMRNKKRWWFTIVIPRLWVCFTHITLTHRIRWRIYCVVKCILELFWCLLCQKKHKRIW